MKRVLVVAYYFPPIGGIGSIRMARFAEYLPEFGWETTVLAPAETPHPRDEELTFRRADVLRSRSFELSGLSRALSGTNGQVVSPSGLRVRAATELRARARDLVFPDAQVGWYPAAVRAGLRAVRQQRFDAVYSSSFPVTAHLIAGSLSWAARLPWVAEFRDPWSDRLAHGPHRRAAASLERSIARRATQLVMPNPSIAEHFGARWQRQVEVVPNGCDGPLVRPENSLESATLTHLGSYYPDRQDLDGLWKAVRGLRRADPSAVQGIRFVGKLSDGGRAKIVESGLGHLVDETGFLPHEQALQMVAASTALFSGGERSDDAIARGIVPAKLFDYLATDLPILYLGHRGGDAARLLEGQPGCSVLDPSDIDGIADSLRSAMQGSRYQRDISRFTRRARAGALARVLDRAAVRA